ncbi:MAG TPA: thiazole synthase, partial [Thermoanaerobaculia bacterium]|nr:thiazole synthase [Thermoanaerobaculia bacterium]
MTVATPPATSHAPTAAGSLEVAPLTIADRTFRSRLFLGTGKYPDFDVMSAALEASG